MLQIKNFELAEAELALIPSPCSLIPQTSDVVATLTTLPPRTLKKTVGSCIPPLVRNI
jgi:hypothetical protein